MYAVVELYIAECETESVCINGVVFSTSSELWTLPLKSGNLSSLGFFFKQQNNFPLTDFVKITNSTAFTMP